MKLEEKVRGVVAKAFGLPLAEITAATAAGQIEPWDSVGHLMLVGELEQTFGTTLSINDVDSLTDVKAIAACLAAKGIS